MGFFNFQSRIDIATVILNDVKSMQADLKTLTSEFPVIRADVKAIREDVSMQGQRVTELDKRLRALEDADMREKARWTGPQKLLTLVLSLVPVFGFALAVIMHFRK